MHAASQIPDEGTYSRVLRRYDRDPRHAHQMRFASYDVNLRAVAATMNGVTAPTLFFPLGKEHAADRATRVGWRDETAAWHTALGNALTPEAEQQVALVAEQIAALGWNELRAYAVEAGIEQHGKRAEVEARIVEHHRARLAGA